MALTGLFLVIFLIVHLVGNLQILNNDDGRAFNEYANFMGTNPLIQIVSKINLILISIHILWAIILTILNKQARGPVNYKKWSYSASSWGSRNMFILGTIIVVFIVIHLRHFWVETHFGNMNTIQYDGKIIPNLYSLVVHWFSKAWYVLFYICTMIFVSIHTWHGISSSFQTLGMSHVKYNLGIKIIGKTMAILIPGTFALLPLLVYIRTK